MDGISAAFSLVVVENSSVYWENSSSEWLYAQPSPWDLLFHSLSRAQFDTFLIFKTKERIYAQSEP